MEEDWDDWDDAEQPPERGYEHGRGARQADPLRVAHYEREIRTYIHDLADPEILRDVNSKLRARKYENISGYYVDRPKLAKYTMDSEVSRMKYTVKYGSAVLATSPDEVRRVYHEYNDSLIWRFANQSIFADMLQELRLQFIRTDLDVGVISRDCQFCLNVSNDSMEASSLFHVVIAGADQRRSVELATILGTVSLSVADELLTQAVELQALRVVFDEVVHETAQGLAVGEQRRGDSEGQDAVSAAPLSILRDELLAVTRSGAGVLQGVTKGLEAIIEANVREDGRRSSAVNAVDGSDQEGRSDNDVETSPRTRRLLTDRVQAVAAHGEHVLEGIVGRVGALVGACDGSSPGRLTRGQISASAPAEGPQIIDNSNVGDTRGELRLYRRDGEHTTPVSVHPTAPVTASRGGLWGTVSGSLGAVEGSATLKTETNPGEQPTDEPAPVLPPPPSRYIRGFLKGLGGIVASTIDAATSDSGTDGGLRLYRREDERRGVSPDDGMRLSRCEVTEQLNTDSCEQKVEEQRCTPIVHVAPKVEAECRSEYALEQQHNQPPQEAFDDNW